MPIVKIPLYDGAFIAFGKKGKAKVRFFIPKEIIARSKEGWKLLKPSKYRTEPKCIYFGKCSICAYQHISYDYQLTVKRMILERLLRKMDIETDINVVGSNKHYHYKTRVRMHARFSREQGRVIGFKDMDGNIFEPDGCTTLHPRILETYLKIGHILKRHVGFYDGTKGALRGLILLYSKLTDQVALGIVLNENLSLRRQLRDFYNTNDISGITYIIMKSPKENYISKTVQAFGDKYLVERIAGIRLFVSVVSTFYDNSYMLDKLTNDFLALLKKLGVRSMLHAYGGIGIFSIHASDLLESIEFVEPSRINYLHALKNFNYHTIMNVKHYNVSVGSISSRSELVLLTYDKPLDQNEISGTLSSKVEHVVVITSSIKSLMSALEILKGFGFRVESVSIYDTYPHESRFTSMVHLTRA